VVSHYQSAKVFVITGLTIDYTDRLPVNSENINQGRCGFLRHFNFFSEENNL